MSQKGGARPGAGRKTKAEELAIRNIAIAAIEEKYGSLLEGFKFLLNSGEAALVKFAFAHAVGMPREKMDISMDANIEQVQIIQLPDNGRDTQLLNSLPSAN